MDLKVGIIDYGISNLTSVHNAMLALGTEAIIISKYEDFYSCTHLILPGVGTFSRGMANLRELGFDILIKEAVAQGKPLLGICLGMQLLADEGVEIEDTEGLGLIPGKVLRISAEELLRLPHMGWNNVQVLNKSSLFKDVVENSDFYFVHSYAYSEIESSFVSAVSDYGNKIVAAVEQGNVFGVQFHPEKSQACGLKILENFIKIC